MGLEKILMKASGKTLKAGAAAFIGPSWPLGLIWQVPAVSHGITDALDNKKTFRQDIGDIAEDYLYGIPACALGAGIWGAAAAIPMATAAAAEYGVPVTISLLANTGLIGAMTAMGSILPFAVMGLTAYVGLQYGSKYITKAAKYVAKGISDTLTSIGQYTGIIRS